MWVIHVKSIHVTKNQSKGSVIKVNINLEKNYVHTILGRIRVKIMTKNKVKKV